MNKEDIFEALKGNVKSVNLSRAVEQKQNDFVEWVEQYYTKEDIDRKNMRMTIYNNNFDYVYCTEPTWPKGKIRPLSKKFKRLFQEIRDLSKLQEQILTLSFPKWDDDDDAEYEIENITVKRKVKPLSDEEFSE